VNPARAYPVARPRVTAGSPVGAALRSEVASNVENVLFGTISAAVDMTAFTIISGATPRAAQGVDGGQLLTKRVDISSATSAGWNFQIRSTGTLRFVWRRATTNLAYVSNETPGLSRSFKRPGFWIMTVNQSGSAGALVQFYFASLDNAGRAGPIIACTNGTNTDGSGSFTTDAGVALSLFNGSTTPTTGACFLGDIWRTILIPGVVPSHHIQRLIDTWREPARSLYPNVLVDAFPGENGIKKVRNHAFNAVHATTFTSGVLAVNGPAVLGQSPMDLGMSIAADVPVTSGRYTLWDRRRRSILVVAP
jgi:hypothetical protein